METNAQSQNASARLSLPTESLSAFAAAYPAQPVQFAHEISGHPLLARTQIAELAASLPDASIEQNKGNLPKMVDPNAAEPTGQSPRDTVLNIDQNGAWIVLKNIEQSEAYAGLMAEIISQIAPRFSGDAAVQTDRCEGFIFVSSSQAVTPVHIDPEHNILFQIEGAKTMTIYPAADPYLTAEDRERFHCGGHRNLPVRDVYEDEATAFQLTPGQAVYVPVTAPHWVQNGDAVSISLSVTWRSRLSRQDHDHHMMNAWRRAKGKPVLNAPAPFARRTHSILRKLKVR